MRFTNFAAIIAAAAAVSTIATVAEARCTRLAFSVNDYGKQGPTDDAKRLLDTYIAKWAAERGVKGHTVGKKDVSCELFLDVGLFDEHTCKAAATVCWPGNEDFANKAATPMPDGGAPVKSTATKAAVKTAAKPKAAPLTTGTIAVTATGPVPKDLPATPAAALPAAAAVVAAPAKPQ
jgi:hypothetical protein